MDEKSTYSWLLRLVIHKGKYREWTKFASFTLFNDDEVCALSTRKLHHQHNNTNTKVCNLSCKPYPSVCQLGCKSYPSVCHFGCKSYPSVCHFDCKSYPSVCQLGCKSYPSVCHLGCKSYPSVGHIGCKSYPKTNLNTTTDLSNTRTSYLLLRSNIRLNKWV